MAIVDRVNKGVFSERLRLHKEREQALFTAVATTKRDDAGPPALLVPCALHSRNNPVMVSSEERRENCTNLLNRVCYWMQFYYNNSIHKS